MSTARSAGRAACRPYEHPGMAEITGDTLRPGGLVLTARALDLAGVRPGARVLDVGCGLGATLSFLRSGGFVATGVEPSPTLLARIRAEHPELDVRCGSAETLPFDDGAVDAAFIECTLSLVADREAALCELRRVLRPGGHLVVSDIYLRRAAFRAPGDPRPGCLAGVGSKADVRDLLRGAGFDLEVWEDHSDALAALAAAIVFAHGSLDAFLACIGLEDASSCDLRGAGGLGYFLAIATRGQAASVPQTPARGRRSTVPSQSRPDGGGR